MMDRSFLRRYAASGAVIAGLYLLNRFLLVPLTSCRLLACGLFWEVVTPLYLLRSVGDLRDVLAVWLGGVALLSLWRVWDRLGPGS